MGEETAVMAMKQGATDYLLKDRLARLGSAVTRALEQSGLQRHKENAEKASRESEERFCQLAANIQEVFWLTDPTKNVILYVSPGYETVWGRSCAAVYANPQNWLDAIHPEDREAVRQAALTKQATGTYDEEYRIIRPDGSLRWIHDRASPVRNDAGEIYRVVGVARDITEQKATQEAIRQSESRLRALLTSMDDLVLEFDEEGRYVAIWTLRDDLLSHRRAELLGRRIAEVHGEKAAELFISVIKRVMKSKMAESLDYSMEVITGHRQFVARVSPIANTDGSCDRVCILSRDVTEQKKLEAQFLRAQRLESIGTLASGVAHDLNNILVPILMAAPLLRDDLPEAEREKLLTIVQASAERGASIVKQVLTFARGADGDRVLLQPIYIVQEVVKIAEKTFPKSIYVCTNYPEDLWTVVADPTQLHQILLNLCINARDAMPTGGRLTLDLENFGVDDNYVSMTPGAKAGPHVLLEVRDTGTGISPENIDKIFDPFFTTKELNHGTGLGLSTVIGIVKSHGGFMQVYSEAGRGTSFKVFLPANVSELAASLAIEAAPSPRGNGELLLVVDDENSILQVAKVLLEGQGYRVLTAADAAEALAVFALRMNEIELVLTDLAMPFMDGVALIRTMQKMKPGVRLVASTGRGGQDGRADEIAHLNVRASLTKPYNKNKLLTTLHDVLTQPSANPSTANAQLETSIL
jgi:PAS domain S-box-containing protein